MVADAVAHRLDEYGFAEVTTTAATAIGVVEKGTFARCNGCRADGKDVVPVDADRFDAVADAAGRDPVSAVLLEGGCRDGVSVVPADEDDGAGAGGGDVERGVEVPFGRGTFAKVAGCHGAGLAWRGVGLQLQRIGCAGGLRDLSC